MLLAALYKKLESDELYHINIIKATKNKVIKSKHPAWYPEAPVGCLQRVRAGLRMVYWDDDVGKVLRNALTKTELLTITADAVATAPVRKALKVSFIAPFIPTTFCLLLLPIQPQQLLTQLIKTKGLIGIIPQKQDITIAKQYTQVARQKCWSLW